jgi:imidazolonepropionase-like amidohydrolase
VHCFSKDGSLLVFAALIASAANCAAPPDPGAMSKSAVKRASGDASPAGTATVPSGAIGTGFALRGGTVLDPASKTIEQRDLFVCDGVVVDADKGASCAKSDVDVTGKFVMPSLTDMHVHARGVSLGNQDFVDMSIDDEAVQFRNAGVTGFLDSMNDEAKIFPARQNQHQQPSPLGADIFASGGAFTPTGGHGTEYGLAATSYHIVNTDGDVQTQMADITANAPDLVKIFYDHRGEDGGADVSDGQKGELGIAMKKEVMDAIVAAARAAGFKTQVHIGTWNDARDAILAGATVIAHLGEPDIPSDLPALAKAHGVSWIPTMSLYHGLVDIMNDQTLLDDPLMQKVVPRNVIDSYRASSFTVDKWTMAWFHRHDNDNAKIAALESAGVPILAGTDTVEVGMMAGWSMHRELLLLSQAGLTPWEALAAGTTAPGAILGHPFGVTPGSEANLLVLSASPMDDLRNTTKIETVIHHGFLVTNAPTGAVTGR